MSAYTLGFVLARRPHLKVLIEFPPPEFKDFNDMLRAETLPPNVIDLRLHR
jgi:hypothetical protein